MMMLCMIIYTDDILIFVNSRVYLLFVSLSLAITHPVNQKSNPSTSRSANLGCHAHGPSQWLRAGHLLPHINSIFLPGSLVSLVYPWDPLRGPFASSGTFLAGTVVNVYRPSRKLERKNPRCTTVMYYGPSQTTIHGTAA